MKRSSSATALRTSSAGFTIVELMVAVAIAGFIVATVFFVMSSSTRNFRMQNDVSQATDRLNYAMDVIKNDLRRASFLTAPNAHLPSDRYPWYRTVCAPPPWFAGSTTAPVGHAVFHRPVAASDREDGYYLPPRPRDQIVPGQNPDRVAMVGAYRAEAPFRPTFLQAGSSTIRVPNGLNTFATMEAAFDDAFIAVSTPAGGTQYLRVNQVAAHPTLPETVITTTAALLADPSGGTNPACNFTGFGGGTYEVVPLHFVRYSIQEDDEAPGETLLVREELDGSLDDLPTVSRFVVARNIVDLQVWFDGVQAGGLPNVVLQDGVASGTWVDSEGTLATALLLGAADSQPENARFAYVQLSARLETPTTRVAPDGSGQGLQEFIELRETNGATPVFIREFARVITVRGEVEMPNIRLANTRTL